MYARILPVALLLLATPFVEAGVAQHVVSQERERPTTSHPRTTQALGIEFAVTSSKIRRAIIRTRTPHGFAVRSVAEDSLAARAGIARGTIVLEVNGAPLREVEELEVVLQKARPGDEIELLCASRKQKRRLLDRKPWVQRKVEIVLPKAGEEAPRKEGAELPAMRGEVRRSCEI